MRKEKKNLRESEVSLKYEVWSIKLETHREVFTIISDSEAQLYTHLYTNTGVGFLLDVGNTFFMFSIQIDLNQYLSPIIVQLLSLRNKFCCSQLPGNVTENTQHFKTT